MNGLPDLLFVVDSNKEAIAVEEARKRGGIPVVAVVDTPIAIRTAVDYVIPGNDDRAAGDSLVHEQNFGRGGGRAATGQRARTWHGCRKTGGGR